MTRFLTVGSVALAGWLVAGDIAVAAPEHGGEMAERCADTQNVSLRARCARLTETMDQNNRATGEQSVCEKSHGCLAGDDRINHTVRPPFWIGHHYSGL